MFKHFIHMESHLIYENLDTQAFKNLDTKIKDNFSASAANNLTPPWCGHLNHLNFHAVKVWLHGCEVNKINTVFKILYKNGAGWFTDCRPW